MSTLSAALPLTASPWPLPSRGRVGMFCLIIAEAAIFTIFVVAYLFYLGKSLSGPMPDVLEVPVFSTICLLSSSLTIHFAESALERGRLASFKVLWFVTFALGAIFLIGTGLEWHHLIYEADLTISTNLFGTTYYSLVGLHASHVVVGMIGLGLVLVLSLAAKVGQEHSGRIRVFGLYWHFVDAVWVVVFSVVYIIGR